jgi:ribosomal protein S12 methylthiotransferase
MAENVHFLTLGCDKNRVDGEVMIGLLMEAGFVITPHPDDAEVIIVNTCGFIQDAVRESIDTVLELAEYKKTGVCRALIIAGCMAERYRDEIIKEIPEADAVIGVSDYLTCAPVVHKLMGGESTPAEADETALTRCRLAGRHAYGSPHIAYVKIAEGCDNRCTYCTIPSIRGGYNSRKFDIITDECRQLAESGARELILVAQDTARYGTDLYGKPLLHELIYEITQIPDIIWIRLMYAYPEHITPDLIRALSLPKVTPYIDMPIQHAHDGVLKRMGRKSTQSELRDLIKGLRAALPDIAIRTTILTGFPGETDEAFEDLCRFIQEIQFDRLGVFGYSREDGTPAARMKNQIKPEEIQARRDKLMRLQREIHQEKQRLTIGKTIPVMVDGVTADGKHTGRSPWDAPDVDTAVTFNGTGEIDCGQLVHLLITGANEYDLTGTIKGK